MQRRASVPFPRSFWVVPDMFLAGSFPGARDPAEADAKLSGLLDHGIRTVINLMEQQETDHAGRPFHSYELRLAELAGMRGMEISCVRYPIRDVSIPSRQEMSSILNAIDASIADGKPVYVHCWGGRGRTGTVVGCYLVRHGMSVGEGAVELLNRLRRDDPTALLMAPDTDEQRQMVHGWKMAY